MNIEQIKKQLETMREMLQMMIEDKQEAKPFHHRDSEFMQQLDYDMHICKAEIDHLENKAKLLKRRMNLEHNI